MLCSLLLLTVGTAIAAEPGYERFSYPTQVIPTIDGMWTSADEWTDGDVTWIGTDVAFRSTWDMAGDDVMTRWLVEFFSDTTDDSGDFWLFCIDGAQNGGTAPGDGNTVIMLEITGHTDLVGSFGFGGDWMLVEEAEQNDVEWANSLSTSPTNSTPHWILEFQIAKNSGDIIMDIVWNFFLQASDASNPGVHAWPPTDPDVPDTWGVENYSTEAIPEVFTFAVMVLLSTVSMLVGYKYFEKRKETKTQ